MTGKRRCVIEAIFRRQWRQCTEDENCISAGIEKSGLLNFASDPPPKFANCDAGNLDRRYMGNDANLRAAVSLEILVATANELLTDAGR
jgi:hypothetical protein